MANGLFGGGDGSLASPFLVEDILDLNEIRNNLDKNFRLKNNIEANVAPFNSDLGWEPINYFIGQFDGDGYIIDNLYINRPTQDYVGLFGQSSSTTIINTIVKNANIVGRSYVGALGGNLGISVSFSRNGTTGNIQGVSYVGGLAGRLYGTTAKLVDNCYSSCNVVGSGSYNAVLFGQLTTLTISRCLSFGTITAANTTTRHDIASWSGSLSNVYFINYSDKAGSGTAISETQMKNLNLVNGSFNTIHLEKPVWKFRIDTFPQLYVELFTYTNPPRFLIFMNNEYYTHNNVEWINLGSDFSIINPFSQGLLLETIELYDILGYFEGTIEIIVFAKIPLMYSSLRLSSFIDSDSEVNPVPVAINYFSFEEQVPSEYRLGIIHNESTDMTTHSLNVLVQSYNLENKDYELIKQLSVINGEETDLVDAPINITIESLQDVESSVDDILALNEMRINNALSNTTFQKDGTAYTPINNTQPFVTVYETIANDDYVHLIKIDDKYYNYKFGQFNEVDYDFVLHGFTDLMLIPELSWRTLSDNIEILTWSNKPNINQIKLDYTLHNYATKEVNLTVPEYNPIDKLERPISMLTYTTLDRIPLMRQQYNYPFLGTRIMKKGSN